MDKPPKPPIKSRIPTPTSKEILRGAGIVAFGIVCSGLAGFIRGKKFITNNMQRQTLDTLDPSRSVALSHPSDAIVEPVPLPEPPTNKAPETA